MNIRSTALALIALSATACALPEPSQDPILQGALAALDATWDGDAPDPSCHIDLAEVTVLDLRPGIYGMLDWERLGPGDRRPLIYVAKWHRVESWLMLHELLHAYQDCTGSAPDLAHRDPTIWSATGGAESAQEKAAEWLKARGTYTP